jgi:aspartate 1-decarboxylase
MLRQVLHSKIHRASVTAGRPDYIGSITVDADILDAVGMRVNDAVHVANCRNGERFETYIFRGERGSRVIEVNGAAARLVEPGDIIIVMHYAFMDEREYADNRPRVAIMRPDNTVESVMRYEPSAPAPGSAVR